MTPSAKVMIVKILKIFFGLSCEFDIKNEDFIRMRFALFILYGNLARVTALKAVTRGF